MHRLPTDEIWHFYLGDPIELLLLHADGRSDHIVMGQTCSTVNACSSWCRAVPGWAHTCCPEAHMPCSATLWPPALLHRILKVLNATH